MITKTHALTLLSVFVVALQSGRVLAVVDYANNQQYQNQLANPTVPFCPIGNSPVCVIEASQSTSYINDCVALLLGKRKTQDGFCPPPAMDLTPINPDEAETPLNGFPRAPQVPPRACPCDDIYNPVCAENGVTYQNLCVLKKCANVRRVSSGACGATNYIAPTIPIACSCQYKFSPVCGTDNITYQNQCIALCAGVLVSAQNACQRPCGCTAVSKPVCSTDSETFQNECVLKCKGKTLLYQGECPTDNLKNCGHCAGYTQLVCGKNGVTYDNKCYLECAKIELYQAGACPSNKDCKCDDFYLPVCGLDKKTYRNECLLKCTNVKKAYNGACMDDERPKQSCASCPQDDAFVCGSDGITYQNQCKVNCENGIEVLYKGECDPILPKYCQCPPSEQPVCGTDKKTYKNNCAAKCVGINIAKQNKCHLRDDKAYKSAPARQEKSRRDSDHDSETDADEDDKKDPIIQFLNPKNPPALQVLMKYYEALFPDHKPVAPEYSKYQVRFIKCIKRASNKK